MFPLKVSGPSDQSILPQHDDTPVKPASSPEQGKEPPAGKLKRPVIVLLVTLLAVTLAVALDAALCTFDGAPQSADVSFQGDSIVARANMGLYASSFLTSFRVSIRTSA